jgi:hypothetical protein
VTAISSFFGKNCYLCHNAKLATSGLNLQAFQDDAAIGANRERFEQILGRIRG